MGAQGRRPYSRTCRESRSSTDSASNPNSFEVTHPPARQRVLAPSRAPPLSFPARRSRPRPPFVTCARRPRLALAPSRAPPLSYPARRSRPRPPIAPPFARAMCTCRHRHVLAPSRAPPLSFPARRSRPHPPIARVMCARRSRRILAQSPSWPVSLMVAMTYPHTLHGTGKRPDAIEERWSRFLFSTKHLVEKFRSVEALHDFEAP